MATQLSPDTERFWRQYLDAAPDASSARRWFYEAFRIGTTADDADDGALLITRGRKTATSSLLWEYEGQHKPLPQVGSLSILENGRDQPVCVVQTTELVTRPFREVDQLFAYDYGEWDRSLKTWPGVLAHLRAAVLTWPRGGSRDAPRLRALPRHLSAVRRGLIPSRLVLGGLHQRLDVTELESPRLIHARRHAVR